MAKRLSDNIITGNDPQLRMCFYYSPHFDLNIWRRRSSLTGERTKKDAAFKGFRQSSSRLKEASPIAASLYKLVPPHVKQYVLYRTLTGEAIKMLKEGTDATIITDTLKKKYIEPLMDASKKKPENKRVDEHETRKSVKAMTDFTSYPQIPARVRKMTRTRRSFLFKKMMEGHSSSEYFSSAESDHLLLSRNISESPFSRTESSELTKTRIKTIAGLIYLGRLPECKKLKMWWRPNAHSARQQ